MVPTVLWPRIAVVLILIVASPVACRPAVLTQQVEARRLAADLHVQFTKAAEAGNRAVMAETDEVSASAAREAAQAAEAVERDRQELQAILTSLGYSNERAFLNTFNSSFAEYRKLDEEILPLAVENTNVKAQRLSFGPAREAADAFRRSVDAAARSAGAGTCCADALAAKASLAVLEIEVLHAPHIAEADDAAMTRMEQQMAVSQAAAEKALDDLKRLVGGRADAQLTEAAAALDRFKSVNREIVTLSRRNSDVRSLALSLGRKRMVTASADDQLRALEDALAKHEISATR